MYSGTMQRQKKIQSDFVELQVMNPQQLQHPRLQRGRAAPSVHLNSDWWSSLLS